MDIEDRAAPVAAPISASSPLLEGMRVMLVTMGCGHNSAESDIIASSLQVAGATILHNTGKYVDAEMSKDVDVLYINSCTVKNPSEDKAFFHVRKGLEMGLVVVLGGCVPQSHGRMAEELNKAALSKQLIVSGVLTQKWLNLLPGLIREAVNIHILGNMHLREPSLHRNTTAAQEIAQESEREAKTTKKQQKVEPDATYVSKDAIRDTDVEYLKCTPAYRANPVVDVVVTGSGCMGSCTYCKTLHSRGRLRSVPLEVLLTRVRSSLANPVIRELWLTGEDTLAWGRERGQSFAVLLQEIRTLLENNNSTHKMVKIGMTDPDSIIGQEDALIEFLNCKYVYKFLHLPVQSGSNRILQMMLRRYTIEDFLASCQKLQVAIEDLCLDTDIICGFPGEIDEDHKLSLDLFGDISLAAPDAAPRFQVVNITQYYARKNTPAASMEQVSAATKRERTREMTEVVKRSFCRDRYCGQIHDVMILEHLSIASHGRRFGGKTYNNITVLIEEPANAIEGLEGLEIGAYVRVRITGSTQVSLIGTLISVHTISVPVRRMKDLEAEAPWAGQGI